MKCIERTKTLHLFSALVIILRFRQLWNMRNGRRRTPTSTVAASVSSSTAATVSSAPDASGVITINLPLPAAPET